MEKGFAGGKDEQAVAVHLKSALSLIALKTLLSKKLALRTALFHQFISNRMAILECCPKLCVP
ncbi:hypothetical protein [Liquorilactobacillus satsumensis]|uniref:hypothetical protein n=1 Tax=Liquorilactobacillus satsumensis TaxID=259059 RepID=UPI0006D242F9|nr:hypothetical protein [Liquorilactobacillus satsumensis]MCP9312180.1 hypothetical protein [Liquorilactobacillus satsumensis]MCP9328658.1 hypothetical protein [Liquorilactobacillus satsumensis]MCP9359458.1 hypothetical protein [Liquorilactobacillus satsumensis]